MADSLGSSCRRLKEHNALVAQHESAYNKAQEAGRMTEGRLPQLKEQAALADREAADAAKQAQHHSDCEAHIFGLFRHSSTVQTAPD